MLSAILGLWPDGECTVRRCDECGFGFGDPYVAGDDEFYSILHEQMGYPKWRWDYDVALSITGSTAAKRVLDIGAGSGNFLRSLDPSCERYAVESSPTTVSVLREHGVETVSELSQFGPDYDGYFDVITMFQSLEHIAPPGDVLQECARLLARGGKLIVTVPDADAMFKQERVLGTPDMPPNHINKWSRDSLSRAMRAGGLTPGHYEKEGVSARNVRAKLHMRISNDAQSPSSIAGFVYRLNRRPVRAALMAGLAPFALLRLLPHVGFLTSGGAFALAAEKP